MQRLTINLLVALATFIIGISTTSILINHRHDLASDSREGQEVLSAEREYIRAHTQRDVAALDRILADDFTLTYSRRRISDKGKRLALLENPEMSFIAINTDGINVSVDGERAMVSGQARVRGRYKGRYFISPRYAFERVYEKRQGRWQVVALQITHLAWR